VGRTYYRHRKFARKIERKKEITKKSGRLECPRNGVIASVGLPTVVTTQRAVKSVLQ
jgi:hypothetical protein